MKPLQPLDAVTLGHLATWLNQTLGGSKINKIQQASHHDLLIQFWQPQGNTTHRFYVNIHPQHPFCCVLQETLTQSFPKTPLQFCVLLRKYLTGARLKKMKAIHAERVLLLEFENFNEFAEACRYVLVLELMGKHSNMLLVDAGVNVILATAHGVSEEMSRHRTLRIGDPYAPPPRLSKTPLLQNATLPEIKTCFALSEPTPEARIPLLMASFTGVGKATLEMLSAESYQTAEQFYDAWQSLLSRPSFNGGILGSALQPTSYTLVSKGVSQEKIKASANINDLLNDYFLPHLKLARLTQQKAQLFKLIESQRDKIETRQERLENYMADDASALKAQADAHLMAAVTHQAEGQNDTDDLAEASRDYSQYKKLRHRQKLAKEENDLLDRRDLILDDLAYWLKEANTSEDIQLVEEMLYTLGCLKLPRTHTRSVAPKNTSALHPKKIVLDEDVRIWVGKSSLQNDWLIKHVSRPGDQWFHVQHGPGGHVLLQSPHGHVEKNQHIAAQLAVYFSPQREGENVAVVTTDSRYVKRVAGGPAGLVQFKNEETLFVTIDEEQIITALKQLLGD